MKKMFMILLMVIVIGVLSNCKTAFWSTKVYDNLKVVELDNSRRYALVNKDASQVCLENVGPSSRDEFYKLALSNPTGFKIDGNHESKASNVYNVGEIMQFGNVALFRLCENYMNGFYDDYGAAKKNKYRNDFNEVIRKITLLIAINASSDKESTVTGINALNRQIEIGKTKVELAEILGKLNKETQKEEYNKIDVFNKELEAEEKIIKPIADAFISKKNK